MMELRTALTERLGIRHPILQAPMATCAGGEIAAAVAAAGGLGMIGASVNDAAWLGDQHARAGNTHIGVGFITWLMEQQPKLLPLSLEHKPKAVMLSFGDHTPYVDAIKAAGSVLICQVQTLAQALHAAETGADIIVAQGQEASGHGMSSRGTMTLAPAIVDALGADIPVVARAASPTAGAWRPR